MLLKINLTASTLVVTLLNLFCLFSSSILLNNHGWSSNFKWVADNQKFNTLNRKLATPRIHFQLIESLWGKNFISSRLSSLHKPCNIIGQTKFKRSQFIFIQVICALLWRISKFLLQFRRMGKWWTIKTALNYQFRCLGHMIFRKYFSENEWTWSV
jgi:hypothetical protein